MLRKARKLCGILLAAVVLTVHGPAFAAPEDIYLDTTFSYADATAMTSDGWTVSPARATIAPSADGGIAITHTDETKGAVSQIYKATNVRNTFKAEIKLKITYTGTPASNERVVLAIYGGAYRTVAQFLYNKLNITNASNAAAEVKDLAGESLTHESGVWYTYQFYTFRDKTTIYRKAGEETEFTQIAEYVPVNPNTNNIGRFNFFIENSTDASALSAEVAYAKLTDWVPSVVAIPYKNYLTEDFNGSISIDSSSADKTYNDWTVNTAGSTATFAVDDGIARFRAGGTSAANYFRKAFEDFPQDEAVIFETKFKFNSTGTGLTPLKLIVSRRNISRIFLNIKSDQIQYNTTAWQTGPAFAPGTDWVTLRVEFVGSVGNVYFKIGNAADWTPAFVGYPVNTGTLTSNFVQFTVGEGYANADVSIDYAYVESGLKISSDVSASINPENVMTVNYNVTSYDSLYDGPSRKHTVILAVYRKNGNDNKLVYTGLYPKELRPHQSGEQTAAFTLPEGDYAGCTAKVYVWNSLEELIPLFSGGDCGDSL